MGIKINLIIHDAFDFHANSEWTNAKMGGKHTEESIALKVNFKYIV